VYPRGFSTYKDVEGAAERLLRASGAPRLANKVAIDVFAIANRCCHFDIAQVPDLNLGGSVLGAFLPEFDLVLLKANCLETRKRFSLAHELGHAQLEYAFGSGEGLFGPARSVYYRCEDLDMEFDTGQLVSRPRAEVLANKFAASILMPEAILRDAWRMTAQLPDCASLLGVSLQSLKIRLHEFEMI
jgi:hypothetical protein